MHWQKLRLTKIETSQEARRLVVAEYQHIVYREWLPIVLGNNFMRVYGLNPLSEVGHDRTFKSTQLPKSYPSPIFFIATSSSLSTPINTTSSASNVTHQLKKSKRNGSPSTLGLPRLGLIIADSAQTEYSSTFPCQLVSVSVTGVTSQVFSIIWLFRRCKP